MRIHHLAMRTPDVARLERFYVSLGFTVARRQTEYSVWLETGDAMLMIERADTNEPAIPNDSRELVAFAVTAAERDAIEAAVTAYGGEIEARTANTIYFRDPDGRRIGASTYAFDA